MDYAKCSNTANPACTERHVLPPTRQGSPLDTECVLAWLLCGLAAELAVEQGLR